MFWIQFDGYGRTEGGLAEIHRTCTSGTMIHAWHHEEAFELPNAFGSPIRSHDSLEVIDRSTGKNELIRPTMISDDLSAASTKRRKMRVIRADDCTKLL